VSSFGSALGNSQTAYSIIGIVLVFILQKIFPSGNDLDDIDDDGFHEANMAFTMTDITKRRLAVALCKNIPCTSVSIQDICNSNAVPLTSEEEEGMIKLYKKELRSNARKLKKTQPVYDGYVTESQHEVASPRVGIELIRLQDSNEISEVVPEREEEEEISKIFVGKEMSQVLQYAGDEEDDESTTSSDGQFFHNPW
jgi:hypothetical protein